MSTLTRRTLLGRATAAVAAGPLVLSACGDEPDDALTRARRLGAVRLGHANEPPYGFVAADGELTGYSVEVARAALRRMGIERVEGVPTEFAGLVDGLRNGSFDVIAAGMYVTSERCRRVAFATPDYCTGQALLVRRGPLEHVRDLAGIGRVRGATLGVLRGSVEAGRAERAGLPAGSIAAFPDKESMRAALVDGDIDAMTLTSISLRLLLADLPRGRFALSRRFVAQSDLDCGAAAFRPEDDRLRERFDRALAEVRGSGELRRIARRFGLTAAELPPARPRRPAGC